MSNRQKPDPQETFNAIARATDTDTLQFALRKIDEHTPDEKAALADALEKHTLQDFYAEADADSVALVEDLMEMAKVFGEELFDAAGADDLYDFHGLLLKADKVDELKGDKTAPVLVDLLDAAAQLSDKEYSSMSVLTKTFLDVAKKHIGETDSATQKPSNPFSGKKFGGPKN